MLSVICELYLLVSKPSLRPVMPAPIVHPTRVAVLLADSATGVSVNTFSKVDSGAIATRNRRGAR
jgi:hypothetical protein